MSFTRQTLKAVPLAGLGAVLAAVLSGCGGATTGGSLGVATPDSSPVVYGLNAQAAINGTLQEASGLAYGDGASQAGVLTAATGYKTDSGPGPLPTFQKNFSTGIPLGFAPDGSYVSSVSGQALPTASANAVVFRAYISTGAKGGNSIDLNTGSVVLTSSEAPAFSQPLTFDKAGIGTGPLGQGQYTTGTFALPAALTTTGLHNLHTVVADVAGQKSETDFSFVVLAPSDSGALIPLTAFVPDGQPKGTTASISSYTATITGAIAGVRTYTSADAANTAVLFAAPGSQTSTATATVVLTHPDNTTVTVTETGNETDTLSAGVMSLGAGIALAVPATTK